MAELKDSGERRAFGTGAVRDIADGKGRCDLLPLRAISDTGGKLDRFLYLLGRYYSAGDVNWLKEARDVLVEDLWGGNIGTAYLDLSLHYEDGARKYGDNNWKKGIPIHCYIDSAVRHYLKLLRGDMDEPHDRACLWNLCCAAWTLEVHPELEDIEFDQSFVAEQ